MPANTWTPTALASELRPWAGCGWRAVEAQHQVATMSLVEARLDDQELLEDILEESKPRFPQDALGLHWLLATPFRYWPLPGGSRFRGRNDPGVLYGAEDRQTACAECGYWRLRFWMDSEGLSGRSANLPLTLFEFHGRSGRAIDLTEPPLSGDRASWTHPSDYGATQDLANRAREAGVQLIRYQSVRRLQGACVAVLTPEVFKAVAEPFRGNQQSWTLLIRPPNRIVWQRQLVRESWEFEF